MKILKDNEIMEKGDEIVGGCVSTGYMVVHGFAGMRPTNIVGYFATPTLVFRLSVVEKVFISPILRKIGRTIYERRFK